MRSLRKIFWLLIFSSVFSCAHAPSSDGSKNTEAEQPSTKSERALAADNKLFITEMFTEKGLFDKRIDGPAVDAQGNLYVGNFEKPGTIGILRPRKAAESWLVLPEGSVPCSIRISSGNRMFIADYRKHRIYSVDIRTKNLEIYVENAEMNQPNDIAVARDGSLFLSDPLWSKTGEKLGAIWKVTPDRKVQKILSGLRTPNGIDLSPDEKTLYFTESQAGHLMMVDLTQEKLVAQFLAKFDAHHLDGIRTDIEGNIYVVRIEKGIIDKVSPQGALLQRISLQGKEPTNIAFGGVDGKTAYVTIKDGAYVETFRVDRPGRDWEIVRHKSTH